MRTSGVRFATSSRFGRFASDVDAWPNDSKGALQYCLQASSSGMPALFERSASRSFLFEEQQRVRCAVLLACAQ
eukprot:9670170-Alexandrium_andersonii.AAC.1